MHALLELVREAPPEDMEEIAKAFKPYLKDKEKQPKTNRMLSTPKFRKKLCERFGIKKRPDWIRNDMFARCPELKKFASSRNEGTGHSLLIDEKALDWIADHHDEIDWRG